LHGLGLRIMVLGVLASGAANEVVEGLHLDPEIGDLSIDDANRFGMN